MSGERWGSRGGAGRWDLSFFFLEPFAALSARARYLLAIYDRFWRCGCLFLLLCLQSFFDLGFDFRVDDGVSFEEFLGGIPALCELGSVVAEP